MKTALFLLSIVVLFSLTGFSQDPPKTQGGSAGQDRFTVVPGPPRDQGSVSGGVLNGKAIALPKPVYPPAARAIKAQGAVSVQVLIGEDGNVISASAISGHPLLRAAAVEASRGAKFSPTKLEGQPVKVSGIITYNFVGNLSIQQVIVGIGFDLANGEITRSFYPGRVKGEMPATWTEELALLDKISEDIKKYAIDNPAKPETDRFTIAGASSAAVTGGKAPEGSKSADSEETSAGVRRFTVVGSPAAQIDGGKFGDETAADMVELQSVVSRRLAENEAVLWYFRYGQSLARLKANIEDSAKAGAAINELQILRGSIPAGSFDTLGPQIDRLITVAEAARADAVKKPEVIALIDAIRAR